MNGAGREATQRGEAAPGGLASGVSGVATGALLRLSAGDAVDVRVLYTGAAGAVFHERCQFAGHLVP